MPIRLSPCSRSAKPPPSFAQPTRVSRSMVNAEQSAFLAAHHVIHPVSLEPPQPDTADIREANRMKERIRRQGTHNGFHFVEKLVTQARLLFIVPGRGQELVFLNHSGFSDDEAHVGARGRV